jgi:hypothetical protein
VPRSPSVKVVREVVRLGVRGRETSLEAWMRANFEALKEELKPRRANWEVLANRLHEEGLTNSEGGRLTAHTARKTWQRVRGAMDGSPQPKASARPAATPSITRAEPSPAPAIPAAPALSPTQESDDDPPARPSFGTFKVR